MIPLKDLLSQVSWKKPIREGVRAAVVLEATRDVLESTFRTDINSRIQTISFRDGIVTLGVSHPALAAEIRLQNQKILTLLAERFGEIAVKSIKIRFSRQPEEDMLS